MRKNGFVAALVFVIGASLLGACQKSETPGNAQRENGEVTATTEGYGEGSAIARAKASKDAWKNLAKEAAQFGIDPLMSWEEEEYKKIRMRLFANERLAAAMKMTRSEGVLIALGSDFVVNANIVHINVDASDEEIIAFLLGK